MGFAKRKLFPEERSNWPTLQLLVKRGALLEIDLAYARLQVGDGDERQAAPHAALLSLLRKGHLRLSKSLIEDPLLASLLDEEEGMLPKYAHFEEEIVSAISGLMERVIPIEEEGSGFHERLNEAQRQAVAFALSHPLSLITGGPGTGKTFTAAQIAGACKGKIEIAAPTGKAAAQLEISLDRGIKGKTLHSLLQISSPLDYLKAPPRIEADLVLIDECSMIAPPLFARLLQAISSGTRLVLIGDSCQLPAIEGGSVFADLIESGAIPTTLLTTSLRSDSRQILDLAHALLRETTPLTSSFLSLYQEVAIDLGINSAYPAASYQQLWEATCHHFIDAPHQQGKFQILSTLRKGAFGVDALNTFFYEKCRSYTDTFPIIVSRNDPKTGLCNGEMGLLMGERQALFSGERRIPIEQLPPYEYAYCLSVHKSQGSEYDEVLLLVPKGSEIFGREVLYTGVTRAKKRMRIDAHLDQIGQALSITSRRSSHLLTKLEELKRARAVLFCN